MDIPKIPVFVIVLQQSIFIGMTRYFAELSFKGTEYHGWQVQPNALTIQEVLNNCFSLILGEQIELTGAGRTDTGVHASYYMAHFESSNPGLSQDTRFLQRLNGFLPPEIAIHRIYHVQHGAHARFDALSRTYEYRICREKDVFLQDLSHFYQGPLRVDLMQDSCSILLNTKDFSAFCKKGSDENNHHCHIMEAKWEEQGNVLIFRIKADRFLRNMVRAIVGTQLLIGKGKMNLEEFKLVLESKNRSEAGDSVPGQGLFLCNIDYPAHLFHGHGPNNENL
jgi:tRNA pseudouridine38-40 synthase